MSRAVRFIRIAAILKKQNKQMKEIHKLQITMKRVLMILTGMFLLANVSCSSDNNDNFDSSASLIGTWQPVSIGFKGTVVQYGKSASVNETDPITECAAQSRMTLKEDGTGTDIMWGETEQGCEVIDRQDYTYTYNSNTRIYTETNSDGTTESAKVTKLTLSEFRYEMNVTNHDMGNGIYFTGTMTVISKKVND